MDFTNIVLWLSAGLILLRWAAERALSELNRRHVLAHADAVPEAFRETIDEDTYRKSIQYTLARNRFGWFDDSYHTILLLLFLFSGLLPWGLQVFRTWFGDSVWNLAAYLFATGLALSLIGQPVEWYEQFRLEERFGFNTSTQKVWWMDRLKGFLLAVVLGYPLLVLILKLVQWTGDLWWLWAWATLLAFQFLMAVLAPVVIMPLFNKFTPLPEGSLRERLLGLAQRTRFQARNLQVMDGSKRSRHSNAFFTGFGRFRKIVLFDTLIQQLTEPELESVLAHEIGHFKKKHIHQLLAVSAISSFIGLYLIALLAHQDWFYQAFGFVPGSIVPALLLFGLLAGSITFWFSPISHWWSRRHEYEADAFATRTMTEAQPLIGALRKLNEKNLSNLTPHPIYSAFYYSHPSLLEREAALLNYSSPK
jgi:STE24 endopeptidase